MNGTIIDIEGIGVSVNEIPMEDSVDKSYLITIKSEKKVVYLSIINQEIKQVECKEL